jgi:hypothetical protein
MRYLVPLWLLLVVVAVGAQGNRPATDFVLDLVPYRYLSPLLDRQPVLRAPAPPGQRTHRISVTLLALGRSQAAWGDEFEYEIVVQNSGPVPIAVPWAADGLILTGVRDDPNVESGSLFLEVWSLDAQRKLASLSGFLVAGAPSFKGTLQRLAPGESVLLRVPARWDSTEADAGLRIVAHGDVQVRASVQLYAIPLSSKSNFVPASVFDATRAWQKEFLDGFR